MAVGVVRAAYHSGNPAIGVGPGNVPVLVDATADLARAARCIVDSKAFDNSILCTNESVLIAEERIADRLERELTKQGAHICSEDEAERVRTTIFPDGHWRLDLVGRDAQTLAREADIRVSPRTRVLIAPFPLVVPEEPLAREKLFPVLGLIRVARRTARHRRGAGDGADRRSRPLGGDPLRRSRARSWPSAPPSTCCVSP